MCTLLNSFMLVADWAWPMKRRRWMTLVGSPPWLLSTKIVIELTFWNLTNLACQNDDTSPSTWY